MTDITVLLCIAGVVGYRWYTADVDVDEKYERRRGASLPASSILKDYNTVLRNNF